jgi:F0F1-type ATP synthase alpha subunit
LRLDLAQYRALAAFAQFGADLDPATVKQLKRGERLVEILKQSQYEPVTVEKQVAVLFVAVNGLLDELPLKKVAQFEKAFIKHLEMKEKQVLESLVKEKSISTENSDKLKKIAADFIAEWKNA